ncbi:hypothetical protein Pla52o_09550 [Novipirellula galeiformis]|uniref:Arrestin-like N-terminal domain-containing protein n=1 Tax=Novipirellula galeiformis TaxID=2528004 RepID=A0A5C6CT94_9BACT|nr:hypothetical protein [Novipirellula galeiformis]TWU27095.1 hypothetical protein Pla52o_09550 [Novipirellula galeiformis]
MSVSLCRDDATYEVGDALTARWRISRVPLEQLQGLEISVLWHTEGKGDEDLHVHHFHRLDENQLRQSGLIGSQSVSCKLPFTPLSYHGHLIRLRWCIRLRLFVAGARETVTEQPFHLVSNRLRASMPLGSDLVATGNKVASTATESSKAVVLKKGFVHHSRSSRLATASNAKRS